MTNSILSQLIYRFKSIFHFWKTGIIHGLTSQLRYRHPEKQLKIICLGGTDGKTTSSSMAYHLLRKSNLPVGLVSTVGAHIGDEEVDTGFHVTAPGPQDLYKLMRRMVDSGLEYLVLETTSQGMYQYRTWGIRPSISGLTNLDNDHLDYHLTPENYWLAKIKILQKSQKVVLRRDLPQISFVKKQLSPQANIIYFSDEIEDQFGEALEDSIHLTFPEHFNQLNARLASKIAIEIGISEKQIVNAWKTYKLPMGRMEMIKNDRELNIIVDFAHTPQGLRNVLPNIKNNYTNKKGRLISILGCAGLRDYVKRPVMGRIAAEFSDLAIFTAEDPRSENVWSIINQMKGDLGEFHDSVCSIPDRAAAIDFALNHYAEPGDTIVVLGKGHEQSINYGDGEVLWNDIKAIKKMLREKK